MPKSCKNRQLATRVWGIDKVNLGCYPLNMSITIEKNTQKDLKKVAERMGIKEKELVDRALLLYLENAKKLLDLEREFLAWDALSDEAFYQLSQKVPARL